MDVRRLEPRDASLLRALRLRALREAPEAYGSTYEREVAFDDERWAARLAPDANPHFAVDDVGLAAGMRDGDVADLVALWVDPAARGTGVADALVAAVLDWARSEGLATVRLHVTAGNAAAERVYARHGFAPTGTTYVRERDGRDVLELEAPL